MFYMRFWQATVVVQSSLLQEAFVLTIAGPAAAGRILNVLGTLFRLCLFIFLRERKPLRLFAASLAFPNIISALAVSHKS
jgi:hypothetical protein